MKRLFNIILLTVLFLTSFTVNVEAHRLQPAYLEISEQSSGKFSILWKVPYVGGRPMNIYPQLPSSCTNLTEPVIQPLASGAIERWLVDCGSSGMINSENEIQMASLGRAGAGLCDWFSGSVLVYSEDGLVLVKEEKINTKFEYPPAKVFYGGQVEIRNSKRVFA